MQSQLLFIHTVQRMNVQLTRLPIEEMLAAVKQFKRNGDRITSLVREQKTNEAVILLRQEQSTAQQIEKMVAKCEESYLNPEDAKRVMMIKRQFKEERERVAREFHQARQATQRQQEHGSRQEKEQQQIQGFDFDVESRLLHERGESLNKVNDNILNIHRVMREAEQLTLKQGEQLDLVSDGLERTLTNTSKANEELEQANKYSKEHNRKCLYLLAIVLIVACLILVLILVL